MESKIINPIDELIVDVDLNNRSADIQILLNVVRIYKTTIETIYSRRLLHSNAEELVQEIMDDAWYAETQVREMAVKRVSL